MYDKSPKCDVCIPDVMEDNKETLNVYLTVCHQHIMGSDGPVDLNFQSLGLTMEMLGVKDKKSVFKRVYSLYRRMLDLEYKKAEHKKAVAATAQPKGRYM